MQVEITPEPTPQERAALLAAVEQVLAADRDAGSAWWEAGVRESVEAEDAEEA